MTPLNKKIIRRLILAIIAAMVLMLIVVQVISFFGSGLRTETATHATVTDSVRLEGLVVRKEALVMNNSSGVISYEISNGTKVARNGVVASVYSNPDAAAAESKRMELEVQLAHLEDLNSSASKSTANPDTVNKQIYQKIYNLKTSINNFNLSDIADNRDTMLNLINQWQLSTGKTKEFSQQVAQLKSEIAALRTETASGTINAEEAGYFVENIDGYENVYDFDKIKYITVDQLKEPKEPEAISEKAIGKICQQFDWYIACIAPPETAEKLTVGDSVSFKLPFASSENLPAEIVGINQESKSSEAAIVFKCYNMDSTLANIRNETVILNIDTYDGIRVSQDAIHFKQITHELKDDQGNRTLQTQEVRGVYVVSGGQLKFVHIIPLYSSENYVICDPNPDPEILLTDSTVSLYDTVAIGGEELYDGKPID